jgi:hypothetical protein
LKIQILRVEIDNYVFYLSLLERDAMHRNQMRPYIAPGMQGRGRGRRGRGGGQGRGRGKHTNAGGGCGETKGVPAVNDASSFELV